MCRGLGPPETSILGLGAYTGYNVSGQPAITIPMGLSTGRLPLAVQIAGRVGQDALVLRAARLVERELGDFVRYPERYQR